MVWLTKSKFLSLPSRGSYRFNIIFINYKKGRLMKKIIVFLFFVSLFGCVSSSEREANFEEKWIGSSSQLVINQFGYPDNIISLPSGNKLMVYSKTSSRTREDQVYLTPYERNKKNTKEKYETVYTKTTTVSERYFELDSDNRVVKTSRKKKSY
jgi:hypothetical protein